jgi:hypothetical protein
MRSTWLSLGLALILPAALSISGCGPSNTSTSTGATGGTGGTGGTGATGGSTTTGGSTGGSTTGGTGGMTGGTGGMTGGTGGFMPPENDACPGQKVTLAIDASTTVTGTLNGATDDYTTYCADKDPAKDQPDVVYQLDVPASATVSIDIKANGFSPALSLRKQECASRQANDICLPTSVKTALDAGTYWLVVDSADKKTGDFTLTVSYAKPKCGDGVVNPGEDCDPAMVSNDDGCINPGKASECHFGEPPQDVAIVQCPGGLISITKGDAFQLGPYNNGPAMSKQQNVTDAMNCTSAAMGPEDVFHITPKADGTLKAQIGYAEDGKTLYCDAFPNDCADFIMYLRTNMCDSSVAGDQLGCSDNTPNPMSPFGFDEVLTINTPVKGGSDYWLIVDGIDAMYGKGGYYLQLSLQ